MSIGLGVILVVVGAVLMWALDWNLSYVDDNTLGLILFIVGLGTIAISLVVSLRGNRTTKVERHHYDDSSRRT